MGCHTWFMQPIERTYEQAKEMFLKEARKDIENYNRYINDPTDEDLRIMQTYGWTSGYFEDLALVMEKAINSVQTDPNSEDSKEWVWGCQPDLDSGEEPTHILGHGLFRDSEPLIHDVFRVSNFPKDVLTNLDETFSFCEKNNINLDSNQTEEIRHFWRKYPNGIICFNL